MHAAGYCRVPLTRRDGTIVAHALVDADDFERLAAFTWRLKTSGYAYRGVRINGQRRIVFLHRAVLDLPDEQTVDHVDRNKLDCRRSNLRVVTVGQNNQNVPSRRGARSRHRGVHFHKASRLWVASVRVNGKQAFVKYFKSELEAADAARDARRRLLPFSTD